jgi:hypothetical protein
VLEGLEQRADERRIATRWITFRASASNSSATAVLR